MLRLGDLAVYNNGVKDFMVEVKAFFPDTDEYEIEFCLQDLFPRRMVVHEHTLERFTPYDGNKKCQCGSHAVYGKKCNPRFHDRWCPLYTEED